jgi:hypothetical protein
MKMIYINNKRIIAAIREFGEFCIKIAVAAATLALLTPIIRGGNVQVYGLAIAAIALAAGIYWKTIKL